MEARVTPVITEDWARQSTPKLGFCDKINRNDISFLPYSPAVSVGLFFVRLTQ